MQIDNSFLQTTLRTVHMETDLLGHGPRFNHVSQGVAALVGRAPSDLVADAELFLGCVLAED